MPAENELSYMFHGFISAETIDPDNMAYQATDMADKPELLCMPRIYSNPEYGLISIDAEINSAMQGMPFTESVDGNIIYNLLVSPHKDNLLSVNAALGKSAELDLLQTYLNAFQAGLAEAGNDGKFNVAEFTLQELLKHFPGINRIPPELEALVKEASAQSLLGISGDRINLKLQMPGPISTAMNIGSFENVEENGDMKVFLKKGTVIKNKEMMNIHTGLMMARSIIWARYVRENLAGLNKDINVIFAFEEPGIAGFQGYASETDFVIEDVYNSWWRIPDKLPYQRMIFTSNLKEAKLLNNVDYLVFDDVNKEILSDQKDKIRKYMEKGGFLVAGISVVDSDKLKEFIEAYSQESINPLVLFDFYSRLLEKSRNRLIDLINVLADQMDIPGDLVRKQLLVSPQYGLERRVPHDTELINQYSGLLQRITIDTSEFKNYAPVGK